MPNCYSLKVHCLFSLLFFICLTNNQVLSQNAHRFFIISILHNLRFYLYFANVLGTIDGTHITCTPSAAEQQTVPNYKGFLLQNCLQHGTLSDVVGALSYSQSLAHSHFSLSHHAVPQLALKLFMLAVCKWGICDFKMKASMTVQKTSTHLYTGSSPQASHGCHSVALVRSRGRHGKWCGQF
jgi:hypothetical protein